MPGSCGANRFADCAVNLLFRVAFFWTAVGFTDFPLDLLGPGLCSVDLRARVVVALAGRLMPGACFPGQNYYDMHIGCVHCIDIRGLVVSTALKMLADHSGPSPVAGKSSLLG